MPRRRSEPFTDRLTRWERIIRELVLFLATIAFIMVSGAKEIGDAVGSLYHSPDVKSAQALTTVSELEILRDADLILRLFGKNASAECVKRIEELTASGHDADAAVWRRIADAVLRLAIRAPPGRPH
jgi:hypothetical protein